MTANNDFVYYICLDHLNDHLTAFIHRVYADGDISAIQEASNIVTKLEIHHGKH